MEMALDTISQWISEKKSNYVTVTGVHGIVEAQDDHRFHEHRLQRRTPEVMGETIPRVDILGVGVHALNMRLAVDFLDDAATRGTKGYVAVNGVNGIGYQDYLQRGE